MARSKLRTPGIRFRCWLCWFNNADKYEISRHFKKNAHPGETYHISKVEVYSTNPQQSVTYERKRSLTREPSEGLEHAEEKDYEHDDLPPSKRRYFPRHQPHNSSMSPIPDRPATFQSLLVNESSEINDEQQPPQPISSIKDTPEDYGTALDEYDPRILLAKETSSGLQDELKLHVEIEKAIARTTETIQLTAASTIEKRDQQIESSKAVRKVLLTTNELQRVKITKLETEVKDRDYVIGAMQEKIRKLEGGQRLERGM